LKKYKIWWCNVAHGSSGEIHQDHYADKKTAERDAALYDKIYPGLRHIVKEVEEDG
jgi:hypothetical protein